MTNLLSLTTASSSLWQAVHISAKRNCQSPKLLLQRRIQYHLRFFSLLASVQEEGIQGRNIFRSDPSRRQQQHLRPILHMPYLQGQQGKSLPSSLCYFSTKRNTITNTSIIFEVITEPTRQPPVLPLQLPRLQVRQFGTWDRLPAQREKKLNPFRVLRVSRETPYNQVKKLFLKIAMEHHPDTSSAKSKEDAETSKEIFVKARQAFEAIVENPDGSGGICLATELPDYEPDEEHADMHDWFKQQTGHDMPFMDEETMKEVAQMTERVGTGGVQRGLDRDGGMWDLARMVTQAVKSGGDGKNLLKLEAGEVKHDPANDSSLRARRRRKS